MKNQNPYLQTDCKHTSRLTGLPTVRNTDFLLLQWPRWTSVFWSKVRLSATFHVCSLIVWPFNDRLVFVDHRVFLVSSSVLSDWQTEKQTDKQTATWPAFVLSQTKVSYTVANVGALSLTSSRWMKTETWLLWRELSADQTQRNQPHPIQQTTPRTLWHISGITIKEEISWNKPKKRSKQEIHHSFWTADGMLFPYWTPFLNNIMLKICSYNLLPSAKPPCLLVKSHHITLIWLFMYLCGKRCETRSLLVTSCILQWHINTTGEMRGVNTSNFQDLSCYFFRCLGHWKNIIASK